MTPAGNRVSSRKNSGNYHYNYIHKIIFLYKIIFFVIVVVVESLFQFPLHFQCLETCRWTSASWSKDFDVEGDRIKRDKNSLKLSLASLFANTVCAYKINPSFWQQSNICEEWSLNLEPWQPVLLPHEQNSCFSILKSTQVNAFLSESLHLWIKILILHPLWNLSDKH